MQLVIALIIAALLLLIGSYYLFRSKKNIGGAIGGGAQPTQLVETWTTAPTSITVGQDATFVLHVQNNNPLATVQLSNVTGRHYTFQAGPASDVRVISVSPAAQGPGDTGSTNGSGLITVVIRADRRPAPAAGEDESKGTLVGISPADTSRRPTATFSIVE